MGYYRTVTIDNTKVSGSLTNFPVYVSVALGPNVSSASGFDVTFTTEDKATSLPFELVTWDNAGKVWSGWVKVPSLNSTASTVILAHYGNPAITTNQSSTAVWDSNYVGVYHLGQDPSGIAPQMKDSTANAWHGTASGAMTAANSIDAKIGKGLTFDASDDEIAISPTANIIGANSRTTSIWARSTGANNVTMWALGTPLTGQLWEMSRWNGQFIFHGYGGGFDTLEIAAPFSAGAWHHCVLTYSSVTNTISVYLNGVLKGTKSMVLDTGTAHNEIGGKGWFGNWAGDLDEARLSGIARSGDWIATEYNNQSSPSTFYALGAETFSGRQFKVYNGVAFVEKPVKVWTGTAWATKTLKAYDGTSWT